MYKSGLLALLLMALSCSPPSVEIPLTEDQLIPLLIDLHTAEMMVNSASKQDKDSLQAKLIREVLILNNIDSTTLSHTLEALAANPSKYFEISTIVADSTNQMKKRYLDLN